MIPKGAQYELAGLYYKIGLHGKVFYWVDDEWKLSTRPEWEVKKGVNV